MVITERPFVYFTSFMYKQVFVEPILVLLSDVWLSHRIYPSNLRCTYLPRHHGTHPKWL